MQVIPDGPGGNQAPSLNRRQFLAITAGAASALAGRPPSMPHRRHAAPPARQGRSWLLRGAVIYDGTGGAPYQADVAVTAERIVAVGRTLSSPGATTVDLQGLALAPGFVDVHSHSDLGLLVDPRAESKIRQGVTTEVTGADGSSVGPWSEDRTREVREAYRARYGVEPEVGDLTRFFTSLERSPAAVNVASMVGHGTVRSLVVGESGRPATETERRRMRTLVEEALRAGACGLSSGLEYLPGAFADLEELATVTGPLAPTGLPYASHLRNEDDQLLAAVEEALNVGRKAGTAVHLSHLKAQGQRNWDKAGAVLALVDAARARGRDVTFDVYPYVAYSTGLSNMFPVWAREGGTDALLGRLADPATAPRIEAAVRDKVDQLGSWDAVQISNTAADSLVWARGRRLGQLAGERGTEPYTLFLTIVRADRNRAGMIGFGMSDENVGRFLAHPASMVCSDGSALAVDGPLAGGAPHPRNFGTFPRVLGVFCRERRVLPLETAIHKMTAAPARRVRLANRGVIGPGAFADLVVFDPDRVADRATFEAPLQYPVGLAHVMVNGQWVLREGERTSARPGMVLKPAGR
ncbi:MAG TPA: D-aminoacylase [Gemmatimonadales bacterium]|nr:D-aminoacylase [Gemmatimonadales bacterium]